MQSMALLAAAHAIVPGRKLLCDQLWCVQSPQAGEAVEFLIEEGKPVEFREEVVSLAPFFGGHIIGDAKYS